jgi:hypothetical protein
MLVDIAAASNELPQSLFIRGVHLSSRSAGERGGSADVFRGTYDGHFVALKRLCLTERGKARDDFHKVSIWSLPGS